MAMHTWFECKIRYEKTMENGMNKKVTEPYLVDALSFTEAEARIIEEMTPFISGEFTVSDIKRANYSELFPCEEEAADRWFKCKLVFITLDEKSGAEKKTSTHRRRPADPAGRWSCRRGTAAAPPRRTAASGSADPPDRRRCGRRWG